MPALLSPLPLLPALQITESNCNKSYSRLRPSVPPPPKSPALRNFNFTHLDPFQLHQPLQPLSQPSTTTAVASPRRRPRPSQRSYRHRRIASSRVDYLRDQSPLHAFDKLPWIASLDVVPTASDRPWSDIADLSCLVHDPVLTQFRCPSGPGPIRRRKAALRSSPFFSSASSASSSSDEDEEGDLHAGDHFPPLYSLFPRDSPTRPSTPVSRYDPSRVTFRDLMPVIDDDVL